MSGFHPDRAYSRALPLGYDPQNPPEDEDEQRERQEEEDLVNTYLDNPPNRKTA